jgi:hypothetical protein
MKFKTLLLTLFFTAGALSSVAIAKGPPPGKGKEKSKSSSTSSTSSTTTTSSERCKPRVAVVLKGEFMSAGADSFVMHVKQANKHGRKFVGDDVTVDVNDKTKFRRQGPAELEDFEAGDWLNVQARMCKEKKSKGDDDNEGDSASPAANEQQKLVAKRVVGKPAKDDDSTTTTTTTSTP